MMRIHKHCCSDLNRQLQLEYRLNYRRCFHINIINVDTRYDYYYKRYSWFKCRSMMQTPAVFISLRAVSFMQVQVDWYHFQYSSHRFHHSMDQKRCWLTIFFYLNHELPYDYLKIDCDSGILGWMINHLLYNYSRNSCQ